MRALRGGPQSSLSYSFPHSFPNTSGPGEPREPDVVPPLGQAWSARLRKADTARSCRHAGGLKQGPACILGSAAEREMAEGPKAEGREVGWGWGLSNGTRNMLTYEDS